MSSSLVPLSLYYQGGRLETKEYRRGPVLTTANELVQYAICIYTGWTFPGGRRGGGGLSYLSCRCFYEGAQAEAH